MSYDQTKVVFLDVETTGLHPAKHVIWETALIVDEVEHVWQTIVPERWIVCADAEALALNGFHDRYDAETAMSSSESAERVMCLTEGRHLVGCNPAFDASRLEAAIRQWWGMDPSWHYRMRDINSMMHGYLLAQDVAFGEPFEPEPPFSSTELSLQLGVDPTSFEPKHSALADARWARACYQAMVGLPR